MVMFSDSIEFLLVSMKIPRVELLPVLFILQVSLASLS